jgi:SAM-dependent methyltransferase
MTARYTIEGGSAGKARLDVLSSVMEQATTSLLLRAGVVPGDGCVDVGCGGGNVSRQLARLVGPRGTVVGVDLDPQVLALARHEVESEGLKNVRFHVGDATSIPGGPYDLAYTRFLLSHVGAPAAVLSAMVASLASGGLLIVEDTDFSGGFCYPDSVAYHRLGELARETMRRRGGNADIGPALPSLLRAAGIEEVAVNVAQPTGLSGDVKRLMVLTLELMWQSVLEEGVASPAELEQINADLRGFCDDPTTVMSVPRVIQAWGRKRTIEHPRNGNVPRGLPSQVRA